jgi:predicted nucleic acid-binding protein
MSQAWVIDPSVLIQGYIEDSQTLRVQTLLSTIEENELHIPDMCLVECTNVLWKQVRFHGTAIADAQRALFDLLMLPLVLHPVADLLHRALTIGIGYEIPVYDSVYIALAEATGDPLITVDERQARAALALGVTLKLITDFPEFTEPI